MQGKQSWDSAVPANHLYPLHTVIWVPDVRLTALSAGQGLDVAETLTSLENFEPAKWGLPGYPTVLGSFTS
jgi:hypothetical protein